MSSARSIHCTATVILVLALLGCSGLPAAETTPAPTGTASATSDVERLTAELTKANADADAHAKAGRLELERSAASLATLAIYDQCVGFLRQGDGLAADASFRADQDLAMKGKVLYRTLRIAYLETIPAIQSKLNAAQQADEDHRIATDPEYRKRVEQEREAARLDAKTATDKHEQDVKTLTEIAKGTSIPEEHPLAKLIAGFRTEYQAVLEQERAPAHKRLSGKDAFQFRQDRIKAIQSLPASLGRTSWGIPSAEWHLSYSSISNSDHEKRYQLGFDIAPTRWPLRWLSCPGYNADVISEVIGSVRWDGYIGGVLLSGTTPTVATVGDGRWWSVLRAPSLDKKPIMGIDLVFDPTQDDLLASFKPTKDADGMYVVTVDASYQWDSESVNGGIKDGAQPPHIAACNAKLVSLLHIKHDGTVIALHSSP